MMDTSAEDDIPRPPCVRQCGAQHVRALTFVHRVDATRRSRRLIHQDLATFDERIQCRHVGSCAI
jgi:hypothetical protein